MIHLYVLDCSPLLDQQTLARALPLLGESRRQKVERIRVDKKKAQSAAAGLLLRRLFGDVEYRFEKNGKPVLAHRDDLHFNLSHSDHYVVCAVANSEIGVDIEQVSPFRPSVARRCFLPEEQEWIGDDSERFTRLWTMKEAYMKLTGSGLSVPAKDILLSVPPVDGYDAHNACWWHLTHWQAPISLCSYQELSVQTHLITIKDLL